MSYGGGQKVQKVMVQPINLIFRYLQNRTRVVVWLYENVNTRIEGQIVGKLSTIHSVGFCLQSSSLQDLTNI